MSLKLGAGAAIAFLMAAMILAGLVPLFNDPYTMSIAERLQAPSLEHGLGTDILGRDLLSRVLAATRWSICLGLSALLISLLMGAPLGWAARRWPRSCGLAVTFLAHGLFVAPALLFLHLWSSRILTALCMIVLPLAVASLYGIALQPHWSGGATVAIGVLLAPAVAYRLARHAPLRSEAGSGPWKPSQKDLYGLLAFSTSLFTWILVAQYGVDALGLGVQPPVPSWGSLFAEHPDHPWNLFGPVLLVGSLMLGLTGLGAFLLGDVLAAKAGWRDAPPSPHDTGDAPAGTSL